MTLAPHKGHRGASAEESAVLSVSSAFEESTPPAEKLAGTLSIKNFGVVMEAAQGELVGEGDISREEEGVRKRFLVGVDVGLCCGKKKIPRAVSTRKSMPT